MKVSIKIALGILLTTAITAAAASLTDLNDEIAKRLAGINNAKTVATAAFKQLAAPAQGRFVIDATGRYKKVGSRGALHLDLQKIAYDSRNEKAPTATFTGAINADLSQLATRKDLDGMVESIEDVLNGLAKDFLREYGDAAQVKVAITKKTKDSSGHYNAIAGKLSLAVDLKKLPSETPQHSVAVLSANATVSATVDKALKASVQITVGMNLNPLHPSVRDEAGEIRDLIHKLLALDQPTLEDLASLFRELDAEVERELNTPSPR
jgi:acetylornithine deacetylase/succinyl-diaminopimelate desuccinylase-like protein